MSKTQSLGSFQNSLGQTVEIYRDGDAVEVFTQTAPGQSVGHTVLTAPDVLETRAARPFADLFPPFVGIDAAHQRMIDTLGGEKVAA